MSIYNTDVFQISNAKLKWLAQRQQIVDRNIANVDTPKYKAKDLKAFTLPFPKHLKLSITNPTHFSEGKKEITFQEYTEYNPNNVKPNENTVVLDEQLEKLADIKSKYQLTSTILTNYRSMYNLAVKE